MPRYKVNVSYHIAYEKDLTIFAADEDLAEEKAVEIVESWNNVIDAEVNGIEEL